MDELHSHRSFTNSGRYAFHRTVPHIADGKEAGNIGLEQKGISFERPTLGALSVSYEIGTSQDKAALVALDQSSPANRFAASAPMKMNIALAGTRSILLVSEQSTEISSRCVSPCASATLACAQI